MPAIDVVRLNQFMAFLPRKGRMSVLCRLSSKSVRAGRLLGVPANSASRASAHSARTSRQLSSLASAPSLLFDQLGISNAEAQRTLRNFLDRHSTTKILVAFG